MKIISLPYLVTYTFIYEVDERKQWQKKNTKRKIPLHKNMRVHFFAAMLIKKRERERAKIVEEKSIRREIINYSW
jgi:hypothetical protein